MSIPSLAFPPHFPQYPVLSLSHTDTHTHTHTHTCSKPLLVLLHLWGRTCGETGFHTWKSNSWGLFNLSFGGTMKLVNKLGSHRPHLLLSREKILRKAFSDCCHINANLHRRFIPQDVCWSWDGERWGILMNLGVIFQESYFKVILLVWETRKNK